MHVSSSKKQSATGYVINNYTYAAPTVPILLQILNAAKNGGNVSALAPAGSIYNLEANKSVELTIAGGAVGGPVSVRDCGLDIVELTVVASRNSTLFICTGTTSMWSAALIVHPTTSTTPLSEMSLVMVLRGTMSRFASLPTTTGPGSSTATSTGT